ncbi:MAG: hypothetical protein ACYC35_13665 [Pirellulales bacterium]
MNDLSHFIASYSNSDERRIAFAWNGKHAGDFNDGNLEFRKAVLDAVLANPAVAPLALVRDLFRAETEFSREAWCVDNRVAALAGIMLTRGKTEVLMDFLRGKCQSFDASMACGGMVIEPEVAAELLREIDARMKAPTDDEERRLLQVGREVFVERTSGGSGEWGTQQSQGQ